jgi:hypothetical protein
MISMEGSESFCNNQSSILLGDMILQALRGINPNLDAKEVLSFPFDIVVPKSG